MVQDFNKFKNLPIDIQKNEILSEIKKCANKYDKMLNGKNILIISMEKNKIDLEITELKFDKRNFYHLTGITYKNNSKKIKDISKMFYNKTIKGNIYANQIDLKNIRETKYIQCSYLNKKYKKDEVFFNKISNIIEKKLNI